MSRCRSKCLSGQQQTRVHSTISSVNWVLPCPPHISVDVLTRAEETVAKVSPITTQPGVVHLAQRRQVLP